MEIKAIQTKAEVRQKSRKMKAQYQGVIYSSKETFNYIKKFQLIISEFPISKLCKIYYL